MSYDPVARLDATPASPNYQQSVLDQSALAAQERSLHAQEDRRRTGRGLVYLAGTAAVAGAILWGSNTDGKFTVEAPFIPAAQEAVESVDSALVGIGSVVAPLAVATLAGASLAGRYRPNIREADRESSKDLTDDGTRSVGRTRRFLQDYAAGYVPVVASTGVALSAIMAGVGYEISEGPSRPIESAFDAMPGDGPLSLVVQHDACNPMLECNTSRELTNSILLAAQERGVTAAPTDLFLPSVSYEGQSYTALMIGVDQPENSPLRPEASPVDCHDVPVELDSAADIPVGANITINGISAVVIGENKGTSAINRIGIETSRELLATCFEKNAEAPDDMVLVRANTAETQEILDDANAGLGEEAAAISADKYTQNSQDFWEANSKPITNVFALMSGGMALLSMAGISYAQLLRNRRSWAANLGQGVSDAQLRLTEVLRSVKNGVVASTIGVAGSLAAPAINLLESGLRVGVDYRTTMVGCAVGILGSVGGTLHRVVRPRKVINVAEDTRTV